MSDKEFLFWIYSRMIEIHGENPNYDYMHKLRDLANKQSNGLEEGSVIVTRIEKDKR